MTARPIEVRVGEEARQYWVPAQLLIDRVPAFFRGALAPRRLPNGGEPVPGFRESEAQVVELPEDDVEGFEVFLDFIMSPTVDNIPTIPGFPEKATLAEANEQFGIVEWLGPFVEAIIIADKYGVNDLISSLLAKVEDFHIEHQTSCHPLLMSRLALIARPGTLVDKFLENHLGAIYSFHREEYEECLSTLNEFGGEWLSDYLGKQRAKTDAINEAIRQHNEERRLRHNESSRKSHKKRRERLRAERQ